MDTVCHDVDGDGSLEVRTRLHFADHEDYIGQYKADPMRNMNFDLGWVGVANGAETTYFVDIGNVLNLVDPSPQDFWLSAEPSYQDGQAYIGTVTETWEAPAVNLVLSDDDSFVVRFGLLGYGATPSVVLENAVNCGRKAPAVPTPAPAVNPPIAEPPVPSVPVVSQPEPTLPLARRAVVIGAKVQQIRRGTKVFARVTGRTNAPERGRRILIERKAGKRYVRLCGAKIAKNGGFTALCRVDSLIRGKSTVLRLRARLPQTRVAKPASRMFVVRVSRPA